MAYLLRFLEEKKVTRGCGLVQMADMYSSPADCPKNAKNAYPWLAGTYRRAFQQSAGPCNIMIHASVAIMIVNPY